MYKNLIGIVGGMGPMASAEFLRTIYECCDDNISEQQKPKLFLISDAEAPERRSDNMDRLEAFILNNISLLRSIKTKKIMVCCFLANTFLQRYDDIIYLTDQTIHLTNEIEQYIILGSSFLVNGKLLDKFFNRINIKRNLAYPRKKNQIRLEKLMKNIKNGKETDDDLDWFSDLVTNKNTKFIVACAEMHVAHKKIGYLQNVIDPFLAVAQILASTSKNREISHDFK